MKSIVLPAGTMHVRFGDLPEMISGALYPDAGTDSSAVRYVAAHNEVLRALRREVDAGDLPVFSPLNPMVPHEFPIGDALNRALVTVADLRQFIAPTGLTVRVDAPEPTAPPVLAVGALVEPATAVKEGLLTKEIAETFDGLNEWNADRWTKNLSSSKWLHHARIALGGAGGASSVWNPLTLAQLIYDKTKGEKAKEKVMKAFNSRFNRNPVLTPWRDAFNEYFATHCTTD